jgi:hypothetical protein
MVLTFYYWISGLSPSYGILKRIHFRNWAEYRNILFSKPDCHNTRQASRIPALIINYTSGQISETVTPNTHIKNNFQRIYNYQKYEILYFTAVTLRCLPHRLIQYSQPHR